MRNYETIFVSHKVSLVDKFYVQYEMIIESVHGACI